MSSQWEVVGKPKKLKTGPISKKEKVEKEREFYEKAPKFEDFLPINHMKNLYLNFDKKNKEAKKPITNVLAGGKKSSQIKAKNNTTEKKKIAQKIKHKNLERALQSISIEELNHYIETLKLNFKESHIIWLEGITSFLNSNLIVDSPDPVFTSKSVQYPYNVIPDALKQIIYDILTNAGQRNIQYFYDHTLTNLAIDLNKNLPCLGHRILMQLIAFEWPFVCQNNLAKNAILRNSYQNQQSVGLSLLWAFGQGGFKDINVGIKVWQNLMIPLIDFKNYSKYVCEYINRILQKNIADSSKLSLPLQEFLNILEMLITIRPNLNRDLQKLLRETSVLFATKYVQDTTNMSNVFITLFKKIEYPISDILCLVLVDCLVKENTCFRLWELNHKKYIQQSTSLLNYIDKNWKLPSNHLKMNDNFKEFLLRIKDINLEFDTHPQLNHYIKENKYILKMN